MGNTNVSPLNRKPWVPTENQKKVAELVYGELETYKLTEPTFRFYEGCNSGLDFLYKILIPQEMEKKGPSGKEQAAKKIRYSPCIRYDNEVFDRGIHLPSIEEPRRQAPKAKAQKRSNLAYVQTKPQRRKGNKPHR